MTNKCRIRINRREIYKIRDLPQVKGGLPGEGGGGGGGAQVPPSCI